MELDELLNAWKKDIIDNYGIERYLSKNRDEILASLFELLIEFNISLEDASFSKRDVEKFMVTEEGKKGKGKHKGWSETITMEFDAALVAHYRQKTDKKSSINISIAKEEYGTFPFIPKNAIITAWAMDRFGSIWNEKINLEAHRHMGRFNEEFRKEVINSEWAKTGENEPEWYVKLIS